MGATMTKWEDITDMLTPKGIKELSVGRTLTFDYEGSRTTLKIMRKSKGKVWAKQITLHKPEDVKIVDKVIK